MPRARPSASAGRSAWAERLHRRRLLLERAASEHRAEDASPPAHQRTQRELRVPRCAGTDDDDRPFIESTSRLPARLGPRSLDDHVRASGRAHSLGDVIRRDRLRSELGEPPARLVGTGAADHVRARELPDLYGGRANTAARRRDEQHIIRDRGLPA